MRIPIPTISGVIRRRILVNFRIDPAVMRRILPEPFEPKLCDGAAIAGICLIRLEAIRPRLIPASLGVSSENAAHRIAVSWTDEGGRACEGVYIPRRDSSSLLNHLAGGRLFPGEHHLAKFEVIDEPEHISLSMRSSDGKVAVDVRGRPARALPEGSRFGSLEEASAFFQAGSLGYSETSGGRYLDGISLVTKQWDVAPLDVEHVFSSYFSDPALFPGGSVELDCALLMRNIEHEWQSAPNLLVRARRRAPDPAHGPPVTLTPR